MTSAVRSLFALGLAGIAMVGGASTVSAGATDSRPASCTFNANGSGSCSGSLKAFRASPNATAYISFYSMVSSNAGPERWAYLQFGTTWKSLQLLSTAPTVLIERFDAVSTAVDGNIYFTWDTTNKITSIQTLTDSRLLP